MKTSLLPQDFRRALDYEKDLTRYQQDLLLKLKEIIMQIGRVPTPYQLASSEYSSFPFRELYVQFRTYGNALRLIGQPIPRYIVDDAEWPDVRTFDYQWLSEDQKEMVCMVTQLIDIEDFPRNYTDLARRPGMLVEYTRLFGARDDGVVYAWLLRGFRPTICVEWDIEPAKAENARIARIMEDRKNSGMGWGS